MITIEDDELRRIIEALKFSQSAFCFDPEANIKEAIDKLKSLESSSNDNLTEVIEELKSATTMNYVSDKENKIVAHILEALRIFVNITTVNLERTNREPEFDFAHALGREHQAKAIYGNIKKLVTELVKSNEPSLTGEALEKAFDFGKNYVVTRTTQPFVVLTTDDITLLSNVFENNSKIIDYFKSKLT